MNYAKSTTTSLLNSEPFKSYKPSPDVIWKSYTLFSALGAASVLPWYVIITSIDYFQYRYPGAHMIRILSIAYLASWLLFSALFTFCARKYTSFMRIATGLSLAAVAVLIIPVMDAGFIDGKLGTNVTYYVTVAVAAVTGAADALAQGSLTEIASELPSRYAQAIVVGTGTSGLLVIIVGAITRVAITETMGSVPYSAVVFFTISAFFIIAVVGGFVYVHRMPVMSYYNSLGLGSFDTVRMLLEDESSVTPEISSAAAIASLAAGKPPSPKQIDYQTLLPRIQLLAVAIVVLSMFTLAIFPGFIIEDLYSPDKLNGWYTVILIGTFILADLLGRLLTAAFVPVKHSLVLGGSAARLVVLTPFFILLLVGPKLFRSEIAVLVLTALLGLSHGYLAACLSIMIPKVVSSSESEAGGIVMGLISGLGCLLGASLSWVWILA